MATRSSTEIRRAPSPVAAQVGDRKSAADRESNAKGVAGRKRWTLGLTCAATLMLILDVTVVNVALPDMERTLHAQLTDLEWVVDAYALALGALLLIAGSIGDRYGRRRVFLAGMAIFTIGSLWSSLSTSSLELIVARGVQGVGGASLFASALALIGHEFRGAERGRALGIWGAAIGGGLAVGPLVGGLLTGAFGWPSIFLVNVPAGVIMLALTRWRMPESSSGEEQRPDWVGFATLGLCFFLLVFGLVEGNRMGWTSGVIVGSLVAGGVLGVAFLRLGRRPGSLFDVRLLSDRRFLAATLAVIGQGVVIAAVMLYLVRDLQEVGGASPLTAGLEILPMTVLSFGAAMAAGRLATRRHPAALLATSLVLLAAGTALMLLYDPGKSWLMLLPGLVVAGAGWGSTNPVAAHASLEGAGPKAVGMASGFNNTARQIGIAAGIGGLGAAFQSRTATIVSSSLRGRAPAPLTRKVGHLVAQSGLQHPPAGGAPGLRSALQTAAHRGMTSGLHLVELLGAAAAVLVAAVVAAVGWSDRRSPTIDLNQVQGAQEEAA